FLDDAPAEERRTLAVQTRRYMTPEQAAELGKLDAAAIARVREEAWPDARTPDELHDALAMVGFVTADEAAREPCWDAHFARLVADGRATTFAIPGAAPLWVAAERLPELRLAQPRGRAAAELAVVAATGGGAAADVSESASALREILRSRLEALGPQTAAVLAAPLACPASEANVALFALEAQGAVMRGRFTGETADEEWCERRLLARIHRYTLKRLRSEIEPATL